MTDQVISPLRRRMIEDMTIRKLAKTQQGYALCEEPPPLELRRLAYRSRGGGAPSG
jgi:hypothetical protein